MNSINSDNKRYDHMSYREAKENGQSAMKRAGGDLVAVSGDGTQTAGAIIWWRISGDLSLARLTPAWAAEGIDESLLPKMPSPKRAFSLAMREHQEKRKLVRPLKDSGGWAIVDEHVEGADDLTHRVTLRVYLDEEIVGDETFHSLRFVDPHTGSLGEGQDAGDPAICKQILLDYEKHCRQIVSSDVSQWLCNMLEHCKAVSLRDHGGVYFVPRFCTEEWERIVRAIRASSGHTIHCVPAMKTSEAVEAFLDAIKREAEEGQGGLAEMEAKLSEGKLGKRALTSRINDVDKLEQKISAYEDLFGAKLTELHARKEALRAALTAAMVKEESAPNEDGSEVDTSSVDDIESAL